MHAKNLSRFFGPSTLVELVRRRALTDPDFATYCYLTDGESLEERLTNAELDRRCRAIAAWMQQRDLEGQRALLLYGPGLDFITAFYGCLYAGVVAVTAYPPRANRSLERIEAIAADADAKVALTTQGVLDRIGGTVDLSRELADLYWLPTDTLNDAGIEDEWRPPSIDSETLAFLQYTSGSTGQPKGVMLTHGNLLHNSALINYGFEHTRSKSGVFWLPSFHDMGLVGGIIQPLYVARSNVLMSPLAFLQKPLRWLQAISKYRGSTSGGPNFAYDLCVRKITPQERDQLDLSCWDLAFNGAEPIRAETLERFAEYFAPCGFRPEAFYPCYGMAETTLIASGGRKLEVPRRRDVDAAELTQGRLVDAEAGAPQSQRLVSSGSPLPDLSVRIVDPETRRPLDDGHVGEIWIGGPSVAVGYWNRPELTREMFGAHTTDQDGPYLRTGDLGVLSENELYITGRIKDVIIVRGRNHYPQDIEQTVERSHRLLRPHSGAVFAVDDSIEPRLVVVHEVERQSREADPGFDEVFSAVREAVWSQHELAVDTIVLLRTGSIFKTSSGKIQRHACRVGFLEDTLLSVARWSAGASRTVGGNGAAGAAAREASRQAPVRPSADPKPTPSLRAAEPAAPNPAAGASTPSTEGELLKLILDALRGIAKERAGELSRATRLSDVGLDSLERIELLATLEDRLGGRFPEEAAAEMESVDDILHAIGVHLRGEGARFESRAPHEVSEEDYRFDRFPEYLKLREKLDLLASLNVGNPYLVPHEGTIRDTTLVEGRKFTCFSSYNYLGLSGHPEVMAAAQDAIDRFGTSVSASRLVAGQRPLHAELERGLADLAGVDDAVVFVGGHATNEGVIGHLFSRDDLILHDALAHDSILQGARLSGARRRPFAHNDYDSLERLLGLLRRQHRRVLVVVEGVYSMDGDIADLPRLVEIKKRHKALLMVDEAHSLGVIGGSGRGLAEHHGVDPRDVDLWMGTLSKALASCGGYIAGDRALVEYLKHTMPGFVFAAGMTPANAGAALAALGLLRREPQRVERLQANARRFVELAHRAGLNTGASEGTAIVPVILGDSVRAVHLSKALWDRGIIAYPIVHPAVEERAARLRFFITSEHTEEQIRAAVEALAEELGRVAPALAESR